MSPTATAMLKLGKQGFETMRHFQSPRINATVAQKEPTNCQPDFMIKVGVISAFYRIFGQIFEMLRQLMFRKMRRISGTRLLIRGDTNAVNLVI